MGLYPSLVDGESFTSMAGNQGQRLLIVTGSDSGESPSLVCVYMYMCEFTCWYLWWNFSLHAAKSC